MHEEGAVGTHAIAPLNASYAGNETALAMAVTIEIKPMVNYDVSVIIVELLSSKALYSLSMKRRTFRAGPRMGAGWSPSSPSSNVS